MVTDGATVMARVESSSVSRDIHFPDETWLSCMDHMLNNSPKSVMTRWKTSGLNLSVSLKTTVR